MGSSILVTGGAGFIGSHACLELLQAGHDVAVVDNLANSSAESLRRVEELADKELRFHEVDLLDRPSLEHIFGDGDFDAVIHFAGLKAVGESNEKPLEYYTNNVTGTLILLETMRDHGVSDLVFSSSATVYGDPDEVPVTEAAPLRATNPYGRTKLMIEEILRDLCKSDPSWRTILLRYFNPVGAHESGRIGEDPRGVPNNLMPYVMQVAVGRLDQLTVHGDDYDTPDGTGVRDYIHVVDLALGHVAAIDALQKTDGCIAVNLGTGTGYSVRDVIAAAEKATGKTIPHEVGPRREGDSAASWADPSFAHEFLGWRATRDLERMCADHWRWQEANPQGYENE